MLAANTASAVPTSEPPEWVTVWLERKAAASQRKEAKKAQVADPDAKPTASQKKTQEKRQTQVLQGVEQLDLWLNDLVRNGLSSLETQPATFWEKQAAQMVDAQAPGLAARLRRMGEIPNASSDWPARLLSRMGQLALLTHAYRRVEQLDPALQEDVRFMVGWSLQDVEVAARGERVKDDWLIAGQVNEEAPRGTTQRTWLFGTQTQRSALVEQFALKGSQVPQLLPVGAYWQADLIYWPSAAPQRALVAKIHQTHARINGPFPTVATLEAFLEQVASTLARQPWRERFLCAVRDVVPHYDGQWSIRDSAGQSVPLSRGDYWKLLALSGGHPLQLIGEWDGEELLPFGVVLPADEQMYHLL
jgi:hypothetical protein